MVIHCSAGIGRTGTLVLVEFLVMRLFGFGKPIDLPTAFLELRQQRALSIQKETQFIFVVVSVMSYIGLRIPGLNEKCKEFNRSYREYIDRSKK